MRVLIVEDEPPIARALKTLISRYDDDYYQVVAVAKNGAEALKLLESEPVEVILTDINIPVMDGLKFMELVREKIPGVFIVVISGYSCFDYVKTALVHKAFDYLLKPVSEAQLSEVFFRLKTAYQLKVSREKELMLSGVINKAPSFSAAADTSEKYFVILMCAGPPVFTDDLTLPGAHFWDGCDWPEAMDKDRSWIFQGETLPERIIITEIEPDFNIKLCAETLFKSAEGGPPITASYYELPAEFTELSQVMLTLKQALYSGQRLGESRLISVKEKSAPQKSSLLQPSQANKDIMYLAEDLLDFLLKGLPCKTPLAECLAALKSCSSSHSEIFLVFEYILTRFYDGRGAVPEADIRQLTYEAVYHSLTYEELYSNLLSLMETFETSDKHNRTHDIAESLIEFLESNYNRPLTSNELSKKFGFVPSYICRIFRQHTGRTPTEYITLMRMKAAKNIMRGQPELMIKEVAMMVGYKNPYHFSKTFKKEEGIWPTEYKKDER